MEEESRHPAHGIALRGPGSLGPGQRSRHEHLLRIHGEMGEAAPVGEERLAWVPIGPVLVDRVLDILAVEWTLELRCEDRDAVQEERQVKAVATSVAVPSEAVTVTV